jgi:hypothetical protein
MAAEVVGNGNPDGTVLGRSSSEKIGFYGVASPVAQQSLEQQSTTKTTTQLRAELSALQNALAALGLITVT